MDFTIWFLIGAAFVFFMQAGFAMVETGFTRAKNAGNIIMKNLIDFCIGTVVFMLLGFSLLVGLEAVGHFCGVPNLGMFADFDAFITNENGLASNFVFNLVFCATAATIVSGAMAERTRFAAYCVYSALISLVVYPIEAGWIWGLGDNAWLTSMGFVDFAGSTAIHMVGGTAALIGAAMEGARLGKYERDDNGKVIKVNAIQGHNIPIGALGVFILWFGWYGFNGAAATTIESLAIIFVNTTISPALAVVSCMIFTWVRSGKPDVSMCLNASLAGLVAITAGCHIVDPIGATVIGVVSGILVVVVAEGLDKIFHVDDPVGAVAVHFANGIWGTLAVGLFAAQNYQEGAPGALTDPSQLGVFYGGNGYLLGMQVAGIVTVITWASVCMIIIFGAIKYVPVMIKFKTVNPAKVLAYGKTWNGLRAGAEEEVIGLDIMEHGLTSAYADFQLNVPILDGEATDVDVSGVVPADIDLAPAKSVGRYTKVTIITAQDKFLTLKDALAQIGVTGMTVSSVMGCGVQAGKTGQYRGVKTSMHLIPKVQVDIVVSTVDPKLVVAVARKVLDDGKVGAGKIFVSDIENVMRVRTGETGEKALDNAT
ncbi:MAG TPA: ammonium transporter [Candidatus Coproplasma avicola]|uniref:Ammonium transporter n=1 Tax=Candidatus Coproplasma avicola TaxID=2840744 RepID=A0A9D1E5J4_9FIRM|nr:ammonium transporter [Candidatus Coproplasma avicola]